MNPWWRLNLLLALCAALLLVAQLWPQDNATARLSRLSPAGITEVRIERDGQLQMAFERRGERWQLVHPREAEARTGRIEQLLAISRAPLRRRFEATGDLSGYGLENPTAVVEFDGLRIAFGERDPSQKQRYVLVNGTVGLVDEAYFNLLALPLSHFTGD